MHIHLIRHTTPDIEKGICYGQFDVPVKNTFEAEWLRIQEQLPTTIDAVYSSPLTRCQKLAEKIALMRNLSLYLDKRLQELHFGNWEMQRWDDMDATQLSAWMNDFVNVRCPQGESYLDLIARVRSFLSEICTLPQQSILIVTHAGVIRAIDAILQQKDLRSSMNMVVEYGGIYCYSINGTEF